VLLIAASDETGSVVRGAAMLATRLKREALERPKKTMISAFETMATSP
jgi:hypothetical protein